MLIVRPTQWLGRFNDSVLERGVIAGGITGGTTGIVACRLGGGAARPDRLPALLRRGRGRRHLRHGPLLPHLRVMSLSILIWVPLALSLVAALLPARLAGRAAVVWSAITLGLAISFLARFKAGGGLQFVTDKVWISALGIHYKLGLDGLNVALVMTTTIIFCAALLWSSTPRVGPAAGLLLPLRAGRERRARRLLRPGPGAVRGLLRPDAHPVLLPLGRSGAVPTGSGRRPGWSSTPWSARSSCSSPRSPPACWPPASTTPR